MKSKSKPKIPEIKITIPRKKRITKSYAEINDRFGKSKSTALQFKEFNEYLSNK